MRSLARTATAAALRALDRLAYSNHVQKTWPNNRDAAVILRAPTRPLRQLDCVSDSGPGVPG